MFATSACRAARTMACAEWPVQSFETERLIMNLSTINFCAAAALTLAALCSGSTAAARDLSASAEVVRGSIDGHLYQNGGVGRDEVSEMRRQMAPFDLRLVFSEGRQNDYAADLKLRILDAAGRPVFGLDHAGPLTDVALPAGRYQVVARFGGVERSARVDVEPGRPVDVRLHWPKDET
jgi:hypothetical protein